MDDETSRELLIRYRQGDDAAAREIFDRYVEQLLALARRKISPRLGRRIDPADVVQSAYRSFFVRARDGDYALQRAGDLWRLLAAMTLHKIYGQVERHTADRRDVRREEYAQAALDWAAQPAGSLGGAPSPEEAAALVDELQSVMARCSPAERQALELRLAGQTVEEIAAAVGCSQRTVRRLLNSVRLDLEQRLNLD